MAGVRDFTELRIWQQARDWSRRIFHCTKRDNFKADRRLVGQTNDSSESVMSNIAEGFGRGTPGEFVQFLGYAIGSLDETRSHRATAYDREYLPKDEYAGTGLRRQTVAFTVSMVKPGSSVKHLRTQKSWSDEVWELYECVTEKERPELYRGNRE